MLKTATIVFAHIQAELRWLFFSPCVTSLSSSCSNMKVGWNICYGFTYLAPWQGWFGAEPPSLSMCLSPRGLLGLPYLGMFQEQILEQQRQNCRDSYAQTLKMHSTIFLPSVGQNKPRSQYRFKGRRTRVPLDGGLLRSHCKWAHGIGDVVVTMVINPVYYNLVVPFCVFYWGWVFFICDRRWLIHLCNV